MSEAISVDHITMTREEYEQLKRGTASPTVTVDAAEYAALVEFKAATGKKAEEHARVIGRMRELEMLLRREMQDHTAELEQAHKRIKQLGG
jgi:hypothetical protein